MPSDGMAPGTYTIEATFSGLEALQTITVTSHQVAQVVLQLTPLKTNTSVTVTASEADTKSPAPTETITEKTLRDAPNVNERFADFASSRSRRCARSRWTHQHEGRSRHTERRARE